MSEKIIIERDIIEKTFNKTKSVNATAKELGIGWSACKRILQEYGIATAPKNGSDKQDIYRPFKQIQNEEQAYWLGLMFSDGWVRSDVNKIGLGSTDESLILAFKDFVGKDNAITVKEKDYAVGKKIGDKIIKSSKPFYTYSFSSKITKEDLISLGCVPNKSKILQCPSVGQVPDKLFRHFLRGCIDGDGWTQWDDNKKRYRVGLCGNQHFLEVLLTRAKILHYGIFRQDNGSNVYRFDVEKKELVRKILDYLYSDSIIYLDRKQTHYLNSLGRSSI